MKSRFVVVAVVLAFAGCGGDSPTSSTTPPPVISIPSPSPAPTATPVATSSCPPVRWVAGESYGRVESAHFLVQLTQVQDRTFVAHPELFAKDPTGAPDPTRLKDNVWATHRAYYDAFIEQGRRTPGLCVEYAPNDAGVPDPSNSEELWIGVTGQPIDAFRVTATTSSAPVIRRYIATNYIRGYGL
jgi:hypothetical protein